MKKFTELTMEERNEVLTKHVTTELEVDRETLNFSDIENDLPGYDMTKDFEVPPAIVDGKHLVQIFVHSGDEKHGRWIRTMLRTYLEGGRVYYRKLNDDAFVATLKFSKN